MNVVSDNHMSTTSKITIRKKNLLNLWVYTEKNSASPDIKAAASFL